MGLLKLGSQTIFFLANVLIQAPGVLANLQDYSLDAISSKAGFADFTGLQSDTDLTGEVQASLKAALMKMGLCDSAHPPVGARVATMTGSNAFDAVRSQWSVTYAEQVSQSTRWIEPFCQRTESARRIETSGEVVTAVKIKLLRPGSGTPSKLRYKWIVGTVQNLAMTSHITLTSQLDKSPPRSTLAEAMSEAASRVMHIDATGVQVALQPGLPGSTLVSVLKTFDDRGGGLDMKIFTKEASDDHWSEDNGIAGHFKGLADFSVHTIILPDEALGIGGTWSIRSDQRVGYSETRWTLVRREADQITLSGTMITTSRPDKEGKEGSGTVTAVVDLKRPTPVHYTCHLTTSTTFVTPSGTLHETEESEFHIDGGGG